MRSPLPKRTLILTFIVYTCFPNGVRAQEIKIGIPITPKPVGTGARALGQSAFIAVADDATAASWNPAGLINLERPEVSFVGAWRFVEEDYSTTDPLVSISSESLSDSEINFMSYAQPLLVGNTDVVLSLNYHQVYDFGVEINQNERRPYPDSNLDLVSQEKIKSKGSISAYTLAGGLTIPDYPEITIGLGINWYTHSLLNNYAWHVTNTSKSTIIVGPQYQTTEYTTEETYDHFRALNFTFGLLWDVYEKQDNLLTFGLVYHTPFTARVDWEYNSTSTSGSAVMDKQRMDIDFPASLGAGVNYRFSDSFSAAFDVEWKEWSKFTWQKADGTENSPVDDDTLAYRLGFEHLKPPQITDQAAFALRSGVFYEPRPIGGYTDSIPVYGFSVGLGWTLRDQFSLDFAYQYRWGEEDLEDFDYRIEEQFLVVSLITYF